MATVDQWVNDHLHDILGISDKVIGQYLIGLAQKAPSPDAFVQKLKDTETVEVDGNMVNFAKELWDKVTWYLPLSKHAYKWNSFYVIWFDSFYFMPIPFYNIII